MGNRSRSNSPASGAEAVKVTIPFPPDRAGEPVSILVFRLGAAIAQLCAHPNADRLFRIF